MKKKMLGIILAIAMTASLVVGCGAKEESATMPEAIEEVEESATKDSVIVAMGHGSEPEAGFDVNPENVLINGVSWIKK